MHESTVHSDETHSKDIDSTDQERSEGRGVDGGLSIPAGGCRVITRVACRYQRQ